MWSNLAAPEAGGIPSTIVVTATIDVGVPENAPLVNKVDIVAPNEPTDAATLSNNHSEATVVTLGPPILRVTLRPASQITAPPGTQFAYIVDYINSGQTDAADVTITTVLPQGLTLVSEDSTAGGWDGKTTGTITWNIGTIPANSSGEIVIVAQVSNSAVVDTVLPVSTTASSSNTPSVTQSNTVKVGLLKIFLPRVGK